MSGRPALRDPRDGDEQPTGLMVSGEPQNMCRAEKRRKRMGERV